MKINIFEQQQKLLQDILVESVEEQNTIKIQRSFLRDAEWNLIIPKIELAKVDWKEIEKIEKDPDKAYSLYIQETLLSDLQPLEDRKYSEESVDTYIFKELKDKCETGLMEGEQFKEVSSTNYEKYQEQAALAFPGWDGQKEYASFFYNLGQEHGGKQLRNFVIENNTEVISFGSVIYSKELSLAYMHNSGTNPSYRRQGYFLKLKQLMLNYLFDEGIDGVYAIVEEDKGSHQALGKLGFEVIDKYFMYQK